MNYGQRLKAARQHKKLTQPRLAELSGVGQGSISKIERGDQEVSAFDIELAYALDVSPLWLKTGDKKHAPDWLFGNFIEKAQNPKAEANTESAPDIKGYVPLISWVAAGVWCEAIDNYQVGDAEDWLPCPSTHGENTYALRVKGDSMTSPYPNQRSYPEGVIIFVDPSRTITNGCRVIAKLPNDNESTFKEYREDMGKRYLMPINPKYEKVEITDDMMLCGVVIGTYQIE